MSRIGKQPVLVPSGVDVLLRTNMIHSSLSGVRHTKP
ncbi:MAG: hypothetical protein QOH27_1256, partial [Mycobacterium sp.]|nr:hypothetical protein [Mycobacterium sp.]